ncbi:SprB repeat-containing protein, partial [bacterium AH-315-M05]|nr:SprB repeat-containing protein [bacterium AH-315-M05]
MKKLLYIFLIISRMCGIWGGSSFAQNLVPNWDFETYSPCPAGISDLNVAAPWTNASQATPDYYNACAIPPNPVNVPNALLGYRTARSGVGFAGLITYEDAGFFGCPDPFTSSIWREYITTQLTSPLVAGQDYCVQFYVSLPRDTKYATAEIGMYLSTTPINSPDSVNLTYIPQIVNTSGVITDTVNWVLIQGTFTAAGGEQYITIGNFNDDGGTTIQCFNSGSFNPYAYYYIEDVCVAINCCSAPCDLIVSADSTDETCSASDGTATAILSGGTSPYTYSWNTVPIQTASTATGLSAGTYTVIVTDASGCADTVSVTVNNIGGNITITFTSINISCNGVCDGTATANPSGGTSPYTYQWDANAGNQTTQTATGLCAGNYSVTITDASGCTSSASVTITQPALLSVTVSSVDVICNGGNGGTATATPNGGASPYFYSWSDGQATATATGLTAGLYIITITDNNNCSANTSVTINEPAAITLTTGSTPENCGLNDGTAIVSATGGILPYTYLWNDSLGQTTTTATGLPAGSYVVIVTDSNNCS